MAKPSDKQRIIVTHHVPIFIYYPEQYRHSEINSAFATELFEFIEISNVANVLKKMIHQIGDFLIDEVRDKYNIKISFEEIDHIAESCVNVAKIRYKK